MNNEILEVLKEIRNELRKSNEQQSEMKKEINNIYTLMNDLEDAFRGVESAIWKN